MNRIGQRKSWRNNNGCEVIITCYADMNNQVLACVQADLNLLQNPKLAHKQKFEHFNYAEWDVMPDYTQWHQLVYLPLDEILERLRIIGDPELSFITYRCARCGKKVLVQVDPEDAPTISALITGWIENTPVVSVRKDVGGDCVPITKCTHHECKNLVYHNDPKKDCGFHDH